MLKLAHSPKRLKIMVSSAVFLQEELLDRIYNLLVQLGYEVTMSYKGTIPVNSFESTLKLCLQAVDDCDLFLGLITPQYGTTKDGNISITHSEMRRAIELNKPRWFLVHENVIFARQLLAKLGYPNAETRSTLKLSKNNIFTDLRIIDLYEEAEELIKPERFDKPDGTEGVKWVQAFRQPNDALLFANAQFSRFQDLEQQIREHLTLADSQKRALRHKGEQA